MTERNTTSRRAKHYTLGQVATAYLLHAREEVQPGTYANYRATVHAFLAFAGEDIPAGDVQPLLVSRFMRACLEDGRSPHTVRGHYRRLRYGLFAWAVKRGLISANPAHDSKQPREPNSSSRSIDLETYQRMLIYAGETANPFRDTALLRLLWDTGARINELLSVTLADTNLEDRCLRIRWQTTKTWHERVVPFTVETLAVLHDYTAFERKPGEGPLFLSSKTGGQFYYKSGTQLVREIAASAGVTASPKDFRHAFVARMQDAGVSDTLIMELTGHRSVTMIRVYGRERAGQNAIAAYRRLVG